MTLQTAQSVVLWCVTQQALCLAAMHPAPAACLTLLPPPSLPARSAR